MEQETRTLLNKTFTLVQILVIGVLIFLAVQIILQGKTVELQNQSQITVSGEGKVYVRPDVALVNLGVVAQEATVADVIKNGTTKMNVITEAMKGLKIDEKDIKSTNYSLTPAYESTVISTPLTMMYPTDGTVQTRTGTIITGYKLEQTIQVKIRDFAKIGNVLDQATKSGANAVGGLQFTVDSPEKFKEQARSEAIKKAKSNAKDLAKESGINLGKIINVYENYNSYPMIYDSVAKGAGNASPESAPIPIIEPGQQEISVIINLTYKVR